MLRLAAVAAIVLLSACGAKEEAPATDASVTADTSKMVDSTAAVDTTAKKM